mgnify:CR=1 FL=1
MGYIGQAPTDVPLTGSDLADSIINSAKIADGTIVNADVNASAAIALSKLASDPTTTVKVGTLTRDPQDATGSVSYTGVGFLPKAVVFFASVVNTDQMSWGMDDGTSTETIYDTNFSVAGAYTHNPNRSIFPRETSGTHQAGVISSFGSDGFTIAWTKTGTTSSGTMVVKYLAIG